MTEMENSIYDFEISLKNNNPAYITRGDCELAIEALKEKAEREKAQETCPCKNDLKACCTCVSMYCYECINKSEYVMGSFCSCCGRKLK